MATQGHNTNKAMEECLKCGIRVDPPAFVLFYKAGDKLRKKTMPLRQLKTDSNCNFLAGELKQRHQLSLPHLKVEKMLRILQEMLKGTNKDDALKQIEAEFKEKSSGNLNKLTTRELELQKQEMDVLFANNQVKMDQPEFEYDKQVDFGQQSGQSLWDNDDDPQPDPDDFWGNP